MPNKSLVNILLLHGELVIGNQESNYNPIKGDWLKNTNLDYVALGHIHLGCNVQSLARSNTLYAYSGCPSGRGFDELGKKGILAGELVLSETSDESMRTSRIHSDIQYVSLPGHQFLSLPIDISQCQNQDEIYNMILLEVQRSDPEWSRHLYKLILTGAISEDLLPGLTLLSAKLTQNLFYFKIINKTTPKYDLRILAGEHSLKGAFIRQVLAGSEPVWNELVESQRQTILLGLEAFESEVLYREDQ